MRGLLTVTIAIVSLHLGLTLGFAAQSAANQAEQLVFDEEEDFQDSVALPRAVLDVLRRDEKARFCLSRRPGLRQVPAAWFEAAPVHLGPGEPTGLVVKDKDLCLAAADAGSFWVFQKNQKGYELVLRDSGNSLELLGSYNNGHRDIMIRSATAADFYTEVFVFRRGKYRLAKRTVEPAGD